MKLNAFAVGLFTVLALSSPVFAQNSTPERVLYLSGIHTLSGYLYKPTGKGPFPSIIFNQSLLNSAMPADPAPFQSLAHLFTRRGWAFFVPGRHSLGPTNEKNRGETPEERMVQAHEKQALNIAAAVSWLKAESYIDPRRIVMMGEAAGGVSSLFALEHDLNIDAMVLFAPGIRSIKKESVKERMKKAISRAKIPIFLIQTQSDANLHPSDALGLEMEKKGGLDRFKVYPAYGTTPAEAQKFASEGYAIWQADFFGFAGEVFESGTIAQKTTD